MGVGPLNTCIRQYTAVDPQRLLTSSAHDDLGLMSELERQQPVQAPHRHRFSACAVGTEWNTALQSKETLLPVYNEKHTEHSRSSYNGHDSHGPLGSRLWSTIRVVAALVLICLGVQMLGLNAYEHYSSPGPSDADRFHQIQTKCHQQRIGVEDYMTRLYKLQETLNELAHQDDGRRQIWMSEPSPTSSYFTAISTTEWMLSERPFLFLMQSSSQEKEQEKQNTTLTVLTPQFELDRASILPFLGHGLPEDATFESANMILNVRFVSWPEASSPYTVLSDHLLQENNEPLRIHLDSDVRTLVSAGMVKDLVARQRHDDLVGLADPSVQKLRQVKSQQEIDLIQCSNQVGDAL